MESTRLTIPIPPVLIPAPSAAILTLVGLNHAFEERVPARQEQE